jgi:threonine synthase
VSDDEILEAMRSTARLGGVFGEPAGVAGAAGLRKAITLGVVKPSESAVVVITGNGLKDVQSAKLAAGQELVIDPDFQVLKKHLSERSII